MSTSQVGKLVHMKTDRQRERERERETDRQTDRERERERDDVSSNRDDKLLLALHTYATAALPDLAAGSCCPGPWRHRAWSLLHLPLYRHHRRLPLRLEGGQARFAKLGSAHSRLPHRRRHAPVCWRHSCIANCRACSVGDGREGCGYVVTQIRARLTQRSKSSTSRVRSSRQETRLQT